MDPNKPVNPPTPPAATPPEQTPPAAPAPTPQPAVQTTVAPLDSESSKPKTGPVNEPGILRVVLGGMFSWLVVPIVLILFLHFFVFQAYRVLGSSMYPTLHDKDYLVISKVTHTFDLVRHKKYIPAREQVIVFHYPRQPNLIFVKRVIGLPGERVQIQNGQVRVFNKEHPNGFDPNTGYEQENTATLIDTDVTVPPDNIFVLGDNRTPGGSSDSRDWGFLPADNIIGNAVLRLWPVDSVRTF